MKSFILTISITCLVYFAIGQIPTISFNEQNCSPNKILSSIKKQTGYTCFYNSSILANAKPCSISVCKVNLTFLLDKWISTQDFTYKIVGNTIVLKPSDSIMLLVHVKNESIDPGKPENKPQPNETNQSSNGYEQLDINNSTASYEKLNQDKVDRNISPNILDRLNGNSSFSFQRGANGKIQMTLRGIHSISGNTEPLVVIDGFAFEGDINNINTNTITDITILKDASATALWGTRGANGVIVITTKKQKMRQTQETELSKTIKHKKGTTLLDKAYAAILLKYFADRYKKELVFDSKLKEEYFSGEISDTCTFMQVLELLQNSGIVVRESGGKLIAGNADNKDSLN